MIVANPANASGNTKAETLNIQIGLAAGTAPGRIKVAVEDDGAGSTINAFPASSAGATVQGHPGAAGAAAVGAAFYFDTPACGTTPVTLEPYSSKGGTPILFDVSGARLVTPLVRQKPDFVGPDGVNDTFLGFTMASLTTTIAACQNHTTFPNFSGTSAATPHAASIAALMLQANPALTPAQIYSALQLSALPMGASPNVNSGYGFIQADAAFALMPQVAPPAPTLTLSAASVVVGSSSTLTWSSVNATSCAATGSWSGPQATSGSMPEMPATAGSYTYTLTCSNTAGMSTASSVTLTVTPVVVPVAPTLTLSAASVAVGGSSTLTWSSVNATSCAASGSWSGAQATSGSMPEMPATAGSYTYSLTCSNAAGASPASSVTLTVTAPPPPAKSGGGGAFDVLTLLGLAGLVAARILSLRRRVLI
jgi:hypothetical protein